MGTFSEDLERHLPAPDSLPSTQSNQVVSCLQAEVLPQPPEFSTSLLLDPKPVEQKQVEVRGSSLSDHMKRCSTSLAIR